MTDGQSWSMEIMQTTDISAMAEGERIVDEGWRKRQAEKIIAILSEVCYDDRVEILEEVAMKFCFSCGIEQRPERRCQCENDE